MVLFRIILTWKSKSPILFIFTAKYNCITSPSVLFTDVTVPEVMFAYCHYGDMICMAARDC
jgi:hypothetical protein